MIVADQKVSASLQSKIHAKPGKGRGTTRSEILFKQPERPHKAISRYEKIAEKDPCETSELKETEKRGISILKQYVSFVQLYNTEYVSLLKHILPG
jgi:hypothetical protein